VSLLNRELTFLSFFLETVPTLDLSHRPLSSSFHRLDTSSEASDTSKDRIYNCSAPFPFRLHFPQIPLSFLPFTFSFPQHESPSSCPSNHFQPKSNSSSSTKLRHPIDCTKVCTRRIRRRSGLDHSIPSFRLDLDHQRIALYQSRFVEERQFRRCRWLREN